MYRQTTDRWTDRKTGKQAALVAAKRDESYSVTVFRICSGQYMDV